MKSRGLLYTTRKLLVGLLLRCPNCEQGRIFRGLFKMEATCAVCDVRYERQDGESLGGMLFNLGLAETLSIGGYFVSEALFHPPLAFQLIFWGVFNVMFVVLFYRHARALWVSINYLAGGVYTDEVQEQRK
jgi:uncharacterized protein (DUF983 family)